MNFAWPNLLWLLALPVAFLAWELLRRRRQAENGSRAKILHGEAGARAVTIEPGRAATLPRTRPRVWLAVGLMLTIVALARPQWGRVEEQVFDQSREILLAVDCSRSMQAPDVRPSRLERAKLLVQALLERLKGERVGLVVFSGTAFLQSPLSADYEILREFLPALGPDYLPEGGTNYADLLKTSIDAFASTNAADRFLIILSDGEATDDDWQSLVGRLKDKGIRVIGLGVGTDAGAMIPDGRGGFVKDERGAVVLSKLESATLRQLAEATGGTYRDASTWVDLAAVLQQTVEAGRKGEFVEKRLVRYIERYQWALAPAVLCLLLSLWREFPVRPKPRPLPLAGETKAVRSAVPPAATTAAALVLLALGLWAPPFARAAAAAAGPGVYAAPLSGVVQRLAGQDHRSATDWAELARETITWGQRLQSAEQPVAEGPVRDGLDAVAAGEALAARAADWAQLRRDLEALLQPPKPPPQQQQQKNQSEQNQQQQKQNEQQQNQRQSSSQHQQQDQSPKDSQPKAESAPKNQESPQNQEQRARQSALGDMKQEDKPPPALTPPSSEMQKVGGAEQKPPPDPALAAQQQKLDQLKGHDSPARLFQLIEGQNKPVPAKKGKDW